jgi:hypothetical protein
MERVYGSRLVGCRLDATKARVVSNVDSYRGNVTLDFARGAISQFDPLGMVSRYQLRCMRSFHIGSTLSGSHARRAESMVAR